MGSGLNYFGKVILSTLGLTTLGTCPYDNIDDDDDVDCLCLKFVFLFFNLKGKIKPTTGLETLPPTQRKAF